MLHINVYQKSWNLGTSLRLTPGLILFFLVKKNQDIIQEQLSCVCQKLWISCLFPFFDFFYVCATFYNLISIAFEVDSFEPNFTLLWCENFVVSLFLPSSCPVYRSATEYNS